MGEGREQVEAAPEAFGEKVYIESAKNLREAGPGLFVSVGVAVLIYLFGNLVFMPISEGIYFFDYPVPKIISFVILVALAFLVLRIVHQVRGLTDGAAGVLAYEFGRARGEVSMESYEHYRTALRGVMYVVVTALVFLLFSSYLAWIHPALAGIILVAVVIWSIFLLLRSGTAVLAEIRRATDKWAEELEKRVKKA